MGAPQPKILRSKEEAEQMASAILAAHRSPARPAIGQNRPTTWKLFVACGLATGIVVALLPNHGWAIGALVGGTIGAIAALIGRAIEP